MNVSSLTGKEIRCFKWLKVDVRAWICIVKIHHSSWISDLQKLQKQNGKWNTNVGETSNRPKDLSYYVKLAPESPLRKSTDVLNDESSYDSFHNYETGELMRHIGTLPISFLIVDTTSGNFQSHAGKCIGGFSTRNLLATNLVRTCKALNVCWNIYFITSS